MGCVCVVVLRKPEHDPLNWGFCDASLGLNCRIVVVRSVVLRCCLAPMVSGLCDEARVEGHAEG